MTKILKIDSKWSVEYDPDHNDHPVSWYRNGEYHSVFTVNNSTVAMFYELLAERTRNEPRTVTAEDADPYTWWSDYLGARMVAIQSMMALGKDEAEIKRVISCDEAHVGRLMGTASSRQSGSRI